MQYPGRELAPPAIVRHPYGAVCRAAKMEFRDRNQLAWN